MIKLFRKVRQSLLEENKLKKYFKYAVGEIILVVIGILIALQLNNYNSHLKQLELEQEALKNLKIDFDFNRTELQRCIDALKKNREDCIVILQHTGERFTDEFKIDIYLPAATSSELFQPQNGSLMDLMNSGRLGVIRNTQLRNRLSTWLPLLDRLRERENLSVEFDNNIIRYVFKHGSWLNADEVEDNELITALNLPPSGFKANNNDMLQSIEFENIIENQIIFYTLMLDRQEECMENLIEIIDLLDAEIE